jgi:hypothetical protein
MSPPNKAFALLSMLTIICAGCSERDLRGSFSASKDGKTYLVVVDDGSQCLPIKVDNKVWQYSMGQIGPINPGRHTIDCGDGDNEIGFDIRPGVVYKFDYWGP